MTHLQEKSLAIRRADIALRRQEKGAAMTAGLVYLCAFLFVVAVGLCVSGSRVRCVTCGRRCDGRICGGTVDSPLCWECAEDVH